MSKEQKSGGQGGKGKQGKGGEKGKPKGKGKTEERKKAHRSRHRKGGSGNGAARIIPSENFKVIAEDPLKAQIVAVALQRLY